MVLFSTQISCVFHMHFDGVVIIWSPLDNCDKFCPGNCVWWKTISSQIFYNIKNTIRLLVKRVAWTRVSLKRWLKSLRSIRQHIVKTEKWSAHDPFITWLLFFLPCWELRCEDDTENLTFHHFFMQSIASNCRHVRDDFAWKHFLHSSASVHKPTSSDSNEDDEREENSI